MNGDGKGLWVAGAYGAVGLLAVLPLLLVPVPALVDYPSHLARVALRAAGDSRVYETGWALVPNLAFDLVYPALHAMAGTYGGGKLFVALCLLLPILGVAAIARALYGRAGLWPLVAVVLVYHSSLAWGFLNYVFTAACALLAFAGWIASERWRWPGRLVLFGGVATALFFGHLAGLGVYVLCVLPYQAWRWRTGEAGGAAWVPALGQFVVPGVLWLVWRAGAAGSISGTVWGGLWHKVQALLSPALFFGGPFDVVVLAVFVMVVAGGLASGALRLHPALRWPLLAMTLVAIVIPHSLRGFQGVDLRLPVMIACLLVAGVRPTGRKGPALVVGGVVLLLLGGAREVSITTDWLETNRDYAAFRRAAEALEPGSRLLVAQRQEGMTGWVTEARPFAPVYWHMSALAVIDRDAFSPVLFTEKGAQALWPRPAYEEVDGPRAGPICLRDLVAAADPGADRQALLAASCQAGLKAAGDYWIGWPEHFDYVLWVHLGEGGNPLPSLLEPVAEDEVFALYQVNH